MIRLIGMLSVIFSSWTHFFVVPLIMLFAVITGIAMLDERNEQKRIRKRSLRLMDIRNERNRNPNFTLVKLQLTQERFP